MSIPTNPTSSICSSHSITHFKHSSAIYQASVQIIYRQNHKAEMTNVNGRYNVPLGVELPKSVSHDPNPRGPKPQEGLN